LKRYLEQLRKRPQITDDRTAAAARKFTAATLQAILEEQNN